MNSLVCVCGHVCMHTYIDMGQRLVMETEGGRENNWDWGDVGWAWRETTGRERGGSEET